MLKTIRVIAEDMKEIYAITFMNTIHLLLKGAPFGILFLVVNELLKPRAELEIMKLVWMYAAMALMMLINLFLAIRVSIRVSITSYGLATDTRLKLGDHLRKLSLGFFKKRDPGDISSLMLQDMSKVEKIFSHFFADAVACIILPFIMGVCFILKDWRMTLLMIASAVLAVPALMLSQKVIDRFGKKHIETRNRAASRLLEYLQGIKVLKAFNLTGDRFRRLDRIMRKLCNDSIKLEAASAGPVLIYMIILELGFMGLLTLGVYLLVQGDISIPVLLIFLVIGYKFFEPLINFGTFVSQMRYMNIAAERITDVMSTPALKESKQDVYPQSFDIEFHNVSFGYNDTRVLKNMDVCFPEKSISALVGRSGSGKTTITNLVSRFWDVDEGSVTIGGVDVRDLATEILNSLISVVFQDVYLFQDTVYNNILVGKKGASIDEVVNAAKIARCHDFISKMRNGYDTVVGEGGSTLSGGEKQRISIARALLKDAPIVLLDEATASIDPENELEIKEAVGALVKSKTLIVIAHRLKTISNADQILVVEQGRISEKGTLEELLANGRLFSRLWNEQEKTSSWKLRRNDGQKALVQRAV